VIEGVTQAGVIDLLADMIASAGGKSTFILYTVIVWGSVLISAFIDNIPYVATMLPVLTGISARTGIDPCLLYFGLLTGATLGGNITPIGASANITGVGILRREGYEVSFPEFARIGIPFTLVAVMGGYLMIWFLWS
jgi:Na+/H+ antiporter NhaD/arsenite permease-like protein